jgi:hypothetical protein
MHFYIVCVGHGRQAFWGMYSLAHSEAGIMGSNPTQGMNIWCVYLLILCLCCPVFR